MMRLNVRRWISREIAIDLGTTNTLVFVRGKGIVMNEPTIVATDSQTGKIMAIGYEAKGMVGMTSGKIETVRPLKEGVIADFRMTESLLRILIKNVLKWHVVRHPRMVIAVPFGVTEVEKKAVKDLAIQAGASEVTLLLKPVAAAIGMGLPIEEPSGNMIVDIGGGTTEVAVISLSGIVNSHSLRIGGDKMDETIIQYVKQAYNMLIGLRTAEKIKKSLGSACPLHEEKELEIRGQDLASGLPVKKNISSEEVRDALAEIILTIVSTIRQTLENTPPEFSTDILERGILLTGGTALLQRLDYKIQEEFGLPVTLVDDPLLTVAKGAGRVLTDRKLLQRVALRHDEFMYQVA